MKKFRVVLAIIAVVAMLTTVAFADASALGFGATEIEYTAGNNLVISVYSNIDGTIGGGGYFNVKYDKSIWNYEGFEYDSAYSSGEVYEDTDYLSFTLHPANDVAVTKGGKIVDIKFSAIDESKVASTFEFVDDEAYTDAEYAPIAFSGSITVKAAETPDPKPEDVKVATGTTGYVADFEENGVTYKNLWVGEYTLTPDGKAFKITGLTISGNKNGAAAPDKNIPSGIDTTFEGKAEFTFKVALTGVDDPGSMAVTFDTAYVD